MDASGLRERRRRDTETEIERAALTLFAERGFERVTMDDVAAGAGVSTRTVFRYFPAKVDLVLGRIRRVDDALRATFDGAPSLAGLEERIDTELARLLDDPTTAEHLAKVHALLADDAQLRGAAALATGTPVLGDGLSLEQRLVIEIAGATLSAAFGAWIASGAEATPATLLRDYRAALGLRRGILA
jgi:AcrR family transcriptional regulator